jgi:hypothetical protein
MTEVDVTSIRSPTPGEDATINVMLIGKSTFEMYASWSDRELLRCVDQNKQVLSQPRDVVCRIEAFYAIIDAFLRKGYIFVSPDNGNNLVRASRVEAFEAVQMAYKDIIDYKICPSTLRKDVSKMNLPPLLQAAFKPRNFPVGVGYHSSHTNSITSFYSEDGKEPMVIPLDNLPMLFRGMYHHVGNKQNDCTFFGDSMLGCFHVTDHHKYIIGSYEDLHIHVVDTSGLAPGSIRHVGLKNNGKFEGLWASPRSLPIIEVIVFRAGKDGRLSAPDARIIRIRKEGRMHEPIFEEPNNSGTKWVKSSP